MILRFIEIVLTNSLPYFFLIVGPKSALAFADGARYLRL